MTEKKGPKNFRLIDDSVKDVGADCADGHGSHGAHGPHGSHAGHGGHAHGGAHGAHAPANFDRAFAIGVVLNLIFVFVEASYGSISGSLALLADAGHNLSDVLGLLLAWGASALARRRPSRQFTYGLRSSSILAALLNAVILLAAVVGIAWEAVDRFRHPEAIETTTVFWVASLGIAINLGTALLFMRGRKNDLNIRGAYLHMMADALVSVGVVIAALLISFTGWTWLDPIVSLVISFVIVIGTWGLLRDSVLMALDAVPDHIDAHQVETHLATLPGVSAVHDLHIWAMSTTEVALTAHLVIPAGHPGDAFLTALSKTMRKDFAISHVTIQVELGDAAFPCEQEPTDVV